MRVVYTEYVRRIVSASDLCLARVSVRRQVGIGSHMQWNPYRKALRMTLAPRSHQGLT